MKVALVVPPFIPVPPLKYGGTELFVAHLAEELLRHGHHPIVYGTGDSQVNCEVRFLYAKGEWPIKADIYGSLKALNHSSWAVRDATANCDVIHINHAVGLAFARYAGLPTVYTLHHPHEPELSDYYQSLPEAHYVAISQAQANLEKLPNITTIHHGIDLRLYRAGTGKRSYTTFIGRIAPEKGTHLAIEVARKTGIPLKIAGEIQPLYREYWETKVKPNVDGKLVEYVGEADLEAKNQLLGESIALLAPIQWDEPFGLILIEAMACGAPVLAFGRGSVPELVEDGISGYVCNDLDDMAARLSTMHVSTRGCRAYAEQRFSVQRMASEYVKVYARAAGQVAVRSASAVPMRKKTLTVSQTAASDAGLDLTA